MVYTTALIWASNFSFIINYIPFNKVKTSSLVGKAPIAPLLQTVNAAVALEKVNISFTFSSCKLIRLSKVLSPSATWYKNDPINESPAPVVSWASTLNDGENIFLSLVINSAPLVPLVYIITWTSPCNKKFNASV